MDVLVGVDAGGTWLRIGVADMSGNLLRTSKLACGRSDDIEGFTEIVAAALVDTIACDTVLAGVGSNALGLADAWRAARLGGAPFAVMSEASLATAPSSHDTWVIAIGGTGSAVATVQYGHERLVTGASRETDIACGPWLGQQVLDAKPGSMLADLRAQTRQAVPTTRRGLGQLGPLVDTAARGGDAQAFEHCQYAANQLIGLCEAHVRLAEQEGRMPPAFVTVGSVIDETTVVGSLFAKELEKRWSITLRAHYQDLVACALTWAGSQFGGRAGPHT